MQVVHHRVEHGPALAVCEVVSSGNVLHEALRVVVRHKLFNLTHHETGEDGCIGERWRGALAEVLWTELDRHSLVPARTSKT